MSKISNTMLMLKYLMNHKKYTVKELAEKLEVSERMVRSYKEDLEKAGIFIETIRGKNGGYILYDNMILPNLQISKYDIELIELLKKNCKDKLLLTKTNELVISESYDLLAFILHIVSILPFNKINDNKYVF